MKKRIVKDVMISLSEYATVAEGATLYDAILALEKAQAAFDQSRYRHRAVLVFDEQKNIVGKISQLDILRALEPKYEEIGISSSFPRFGLGPRFQKAMLEQLRLWNKPLTDICKKASRLQIRDFMYTPAEGEYIKEDASLDEAIHQLIMGHHQSLLVIKEKKIVGILRLTDVFMEIVQVIKSCNV
jgi:CBS domain-containing protein